MTYEPNFGNVATSMVATLEGTTSTTYADLATVGPSVTINTGTTAIIWYSAGGLNTTSTTGTHWISVAVSGATTIAASDNNGCPVGFNAIANRVSNMSRVIVITGLTPGVNTFTLKYRADVNTATTQFGWRSIAAQGLP